MDIKELLEEAIYKRIDEFNDLEVGTEEFKSEADVLAKLTDRVIEIEKVRVDYQERVNDRENEIELKQLEMDDERKDRFIKNCLTGASIVTGVGLTVWGTLKSLKFEEDGTVTTIVGRGFINKLLPSRK